MRKKLKNNSDAMSFLDHLEELRWHIIRAVIGILVFAIAAFVYHEFVFDWIIMAPQTPEFFTNFQMCRFGKWIGIEALCINSEPLEIINIKLAGQFTTHISVSIIGGVIAAFPYIFWELWSFISPALHDNEKSHARGAVFYSSALFLTGVLFGYYVLTPLAVHFLGSYSVSDLVENKISLDSYIATVTSVTLACGVIFELPVVIFFFSKIGLVTPKLLKHYRRHAVVVVLIVSAIITPPDVFSHILVALPLMLLYETGIGISRRVQRKHEKVEQNTIKLIE